jgi:hypothetical protein
MNAPALLRVAAVVAALQFAAHATLFLRARPSHGPAEVAVVDAMKRERFDFGRARRSYWEMYTGYGLEAAFVCLVEAILLWQVASISAAAPAMARPIILLALVANLGHAILVLRYFFFVPLIPDLVLVVLLAGALVVRPTLPNVRGEARYDPVEPQPGVRYITPAAARR